MRMSVSQFADVSARQKRSAEGRPLKLKPTEPLEKHVQAAVIARLRRHPMVAWVERLNSGAHKTEAGGFVRYGFPGCPDVVAGLKDGRTAWIEVKRPSGKPSEAQVAFIEICATYGIPCGIARSADEAVAIIEQPINAGREASRHMTPRMGQPAPILETRERGYP